MAPSPLPIQPRRKRKWLRAASIISGFARCAPPRGPQPRKSCPRARGLRGLRQQGRRRMPLPCRDPRRKPRPLKRPLKTPARQRAPARPTTRGGVLRFLPATRTWQMAPACLASPPVQPRPQPRRRQHRAHLIPGNPRGAKAERRIRLATEADPIRLALRSQLAPCNCPTRRRRKRQPSRSGAGPLLQVQIRHRRRARLPLRRFRSPNARSRFRPAT